MQHMPLGGGTLATHAGYASLGRGRGDRGQERLAALAASAAFPGDRLGMDELRGLIEIVRRWDTDGRLGVVTDYATLGVEALLGRWNADLVGTLRRQSQPGQASRADRMVQATMGTDLGRGFSLAGAYMYQYTHDRRPNGADLHVVALQLTYSFTHCNGCRVLGHRYD
jgi:hypothetical protein